MIVHLVIVVLHMRNSTVPRATPQCCEVVRTNSKERFIVSAEDRTLVCVECSQQFAFTAGEQEFYQEKGLMHEPRRCPDCRTSRRRERYGERQMHEGVCAECGSVARVPFEPRDDRPIYCSDCFTNRRDN
jgi:CxxC-x17-CxxC domain-containing protein